MGTTLQRDNRPVKDVTGRSNFVEAPGNNATGFTGWRPASDEKVQQTDSTTPAPQFHNQNTD